MIQIQEKDVLWRFYQRYYKYLTIFGQEPEPKNLCNYFWKSVVGAFKWFFWDANIFVVVPVFAIMTFLMISWACWSGIFLDNQQSVWVSVIGIGFFLITIGFTGFCAFLAPIFRWFDDWSKKGKEDVCCISGLVMAAIFIAVLISTGFAKNAPWRWYYLLYGFLCELVFLVVVVMGVAIWYVLFSDNTNLGKNILQYLKAIKGRFCPLVEPPQSYKDAQKESQLNCGDGFTVL